MASVHAYSVCHIILPLIGGAQTDLPIAVQLRLQMDRMPLALLTSVSKMSFPAKGKKSAASKHDEEPPKVSHKLPNGKVISSARFGLLHNSFGFLQCVYKSRSRLLLRAFEGHSVSLERPSVVWGRDESNKENIVFHD